MVSGIKFKRFRGWKIIDCGKNSVLLRCCFFFRILDLAKYKVLICKESYFRGVRIFCTAVYCLWSESKHKADVTA